MYSTSSYIENIPPDITYRAVAATNNLLPEKSSKTQLVKKIASEFRTLPSFENTVLEQKYTKHYSLQRNELLKCRWRQYLNHIEERVFAPFQFPDVRDLHFYKQSIRFVPAQSLFRPRDNRMKLKPGPGVDSRGQMPIPGELLMRRGKSQKHDKTGKHISKSAQKGNAIKTVKKQKKIE